MKKFLKKNLAVIIFIGILLVVAGGLAAAIIHVSNQKEPEIDIENNIVNEYLGSAKQVAIPSNITTIADSAFNNKTTIQTITFAKDSKLKFIGSRAFSECTSLENIALPNGVEHIGAHAFDFCTSLETIIIPEGVKIIEDYAFANCRNLKSVSLPSTLETLGESIFQNCPSLTSVTTKGTNFVSVDNALYNADKTILYRYFPGATAISYEAPETLKVVNIEAFQDAEALKYITIGKNVVELGSRAFAGCINLEELVIPFLGSTANKKDAKAFACFFDEVPDTLKKVEVLGGTIVPNEAFKSCSKIEHIIIGEGIIAIGENAFKFCSKLVDVKLPSTITKINPGAFANVNKKATIIVNEFESDFLPTSGDTSGWNPQPLTIIFKQAENE